MPSNHSCTIDVERAFGPSVSSTCLGGFDFTLLFEETILTILPLGLTCKLSLSRRRAREPPRLRLSHSNALSLQFFYRWDALFNCAMRSPRSTSHGFCLSKW